MTTKLGSFSVPSSVVESLGAFGKENSVHAIQANPAWVGFTDYVDRVSADELKYPVSIFTDKYNRRCISLRCRATRENENKSFLVVVTLFQRYTQDPGFWAIASPIQSLVGSFSRGKDDISKICSNDGLVVDKLRVCLDI